MTKNAFMPNAGDSIIVRLKIDGNIQALAQLTGKITELNGRIGAIDLVRPLSNGGSIRDLIVYTSGSSHAEDIVEALKTVDGVELIH
jgi:malate dehydrogenase (oxaloacetate-decarboxylating)